MDPLAWLGLRKPKEAHPNLAAVHDVVRDLLPDDEAVVLRYIVVVAVLLRRVANADGVFLECELQRLRRLFEHIDRMPPDGIDELCTTLHEHVPKLNKAELQLCYRELKSLCDARERLQVLRLLASQATADGQIVQSEHGALAEIAEGLDIAEADLADVESQALADVIPDKPESVPSPTDSAGQQRAPSEKD